MREKTRLDLIEGLIIASLFLGWIFYALMAISGLWFKRADNHIDGFVLAILMVLIAAFILSIAAGIWAMVYYHWAMILLSLAFYVSEGIAFVIFSSRSKRFGWTYLAMLH